MCKHAACVCGCVHADDFGDKKLILQASFTGQQIRNRKKWHHKYAINDPGRALFPRSSHHLPLKYFGVSNLTGGQSFIQHYLTFYVYKSHESHHRSGFVVRCELLYSIWSIVYFHTYELPVSAHLKNYLNQDNLAGNTWVSFSAFAWDSPCLWLVLNYQYNSSSFLSLSYF